MKTVDAFHHLESLKAHLYSHDIKKKHISGIDVYKSVNYSYKQLLKACFGNISTYLDIRLNSKRNILDKKNPSFLSILMLRKDSLSERFGSRVYSENKTLITLGRRCR